MSKFITLLSILFLFGLTVSAQEADDPLKTAAADVYLAKDDGTGRPGEQADGFVVTDVPIHCVVQLGSGESATVKMNLVASNVPGVKPETNVVSTSYTTKDFQDRVNFSGRPHGKWVAGEYRADIFVDDKLVKTITFLISRPVKKPQVPESIGSRIKRPQRTRGN